MDEICAFGETVVAELEDGKIRERALMPEEFGLERSPYTNIAGGNAEENAKLMLELLSGHCADAGSRMGGMLNTTVCNAAAAIYVSGRCRTLGEGARLAHEALESGKAMEKLEALKEASNE